MKRNVMFLVLVFFSLFLGLNTVFAQRGTQETIQIRLATPLPQNSDWGKAIDRIAAEWGRVTNNQVRAIPQHQVQGGEGVILTSLRTNNMQAALLTSMGMSEICPPVMTLSVPFLISNDGELDMVLEEVLPILDGYMNRTDFVAICWSKAGWVYIFSQEPIFDPDSLRRQRLGSNTEVTDINNTFRTMGLNVIEVGLSDIGTKLAAKAINAIYMIPEGIIPYNLHIYVNNMLDLPIAPGIGAIVMNRVTWNKLGAQNQRNIVAVTQRIATEFQVTMARVSANAVTTLQRNGLRVNRPSQPQVDMWRTEIDRVLPSLLGTAYDRNVYDRINQVLARARNR